MVITYFAREKGKPDLLQGLAAGNAGSVQLISRLAELFDTNDQNASKNNGDEYGHFGTFLNDAAAGIPAYAMANGGYALRVTPRAFDFPKYKQSIGRSEPVILFFKEPDRKIGHVVVGYGYRATKVLFKDPADGMKGEADSSAVISSTDVAGSLTRSYGQTPPLPLPRSRASGQWVDVVELEVSDVSP